MDKFNKRVTGISLILSLAIGLMSGPLPARSAQPPDTVEMKSSAAMRVLYRAFGSQHFNQFILTLEPGGSKPDEYAIKNQDDKIVIKGNSLIALCRGAYDYLKNHCNGIYTWSGSRIFIPETFPAIDKRTQSPYLHRYYFNVVTHGYSTAFWDWRRWEKEIDWMALHGINMPLIGGAHEAILNRVFKKLGLTRAEIKQYFSGPAFFPWNRMGNLNGWGGPLPDSYFDKQIRLTHQILNRMRELGMSPIIHSFAGFVPKGTRRIFPNIEIRELEWGGGLPKEFNAYILPPGSGLFIEIGKRYIREWEAEFGKGKYYLADSFNEMDAPVSADPEKELKELAEYGESAYRSVSEAQPDAVWVVQGWTFPFHKDKNGLRFWTPERLRALLSKIPDDKALILDLANEYNHVFWKIEPCWKTYQGFFGKKWIYSFIPNMGGKVPLNGILDVYASIPIDALNYEHRKNLVGFGFAPEGIENNEIVYELLSDMAWSWEKTDMAAWTEKYCRQRYGAFPEKMKEAFILLNKSCYGAFTDHPIHRYQLRPYKKPEGVEKNATVHYSEAFTKAVGAFLSCASELKNSELYVYDAIEITSQYLGLEADKRLLAYLDAKDKDANADLSEPLEILLTMDKLLASHPNHGLKKWLAYARSWGDNEREKNYYEGNAKRLLTTWGGNPVNDYSARMWSGLIRDYYVPRWKMRHESGSDGSRRALRAWEEKWITTSGLSPDEPFADPLAEAIKMYHTFSGSGAAAKHPESR